MIRSLAAVLLVLAVAAGCSTTSGARASAVPSASPTRDAAGDDCPGSRQDGTAVYIGDDAAGYLAGYRFGTGPVGVVFGHESDGSACDWMYQARALSKQGYTTLALDFDGYGASTKRGNRFGEDIDDAVTFLGAHGVTSVVLWGSSMGGDAVLAAVPGSSLPVDAVIALSPPSAFGGADAIGAVPHITVPVLFAVGTYDASFAPDVQALYRATASRHKQLILEQTSSHGRQLMTYPDVTAAVQHYLTTYAPPAGTQ